MAQQTQGNRPAGLDDVQQLRDEIKLKLHLASMEAKDQWSQLEAQLQELENEAKHAGDTTREFIGELKTKLIAFRDRLQG